MAKGKLIALEAGDGSGKATQAQMLYDTLKNAGYPVHLSRLQLGVLGARAHVPAR